MADTDTINNHAAFIWSVADLLRGDYKQSEYGKVILPLAVLRRLDCVLEPTKARRARQAPSSSRAGSRTSSRSSRPSPGEQFYNTVAADLHASCSTTRPTSPTTCAPTSPGSRRRPATSSRSSTSTPRSTGSTEGEPALPGRLEVRRDRPPPRRRLEPRDGLPLRGADPPVLRAVQRDRRRALHAARGHPADGRTCCSSRTTTSLTKPGIVQTLLRPGVRHRRDAVGRRGPPARAEPAGPARGLRPGAERRDLRHLPLRHDAQGPGRLPHRLRQLASPRTATRAHASTTCSPTRRSASSGRRSRTRSGPRRRPSSASPAASAPACRASTTARSCSCST